MAGKRRSSRGIATARCVHTGPETIHLMVEFTLQELLPIQIRQQGRRPARSGETHSH